MFARRCSRRSRALVLLAACTLVVVHCSCGAPAGETVVVEARARHDHRDIPLPEGLGGPLAYSPDGRLVATERGLKLFVWDLKADKKVAGFEGSLDQPSSPHFSPDGRYLGAVKRGKEQPWFKAESEDLIEPDDSSRRRSRSVATQRPFDPEERLKSPWGSSIVLYDVKTGTVAKTLAEHEQHIHSFCFSLDGRRIATASFDGTAVIWDVESGERLRVFEDGRQVRSVAFSPDGKLLATAAGWEYSTAMLREALGKKEPPRPPVAVWDVETGAKLKELGKPNGWAGVKFSPDGRYLAVSSGVITLWDTTTWQPARRFPPGSSAFSPDGRLIAVETALWDVGTGRKLASFSKPSVYNVEFSPDGECLAVLKKGIRLLRVADLLAVEAPSVTLAKPPTPATAGKADPELDRILGRLRKHGGLRFGVWNSLTHAAVWGEGEERVLRVLGAMQACEKGDRSELEELGGLVGVKKELRACLKSRDPVVRAGAALMIGLVGDRRLAADVAALLAGKRSVDVARIVAEKVAKRDDRWARFSEAEMTEYITEHFERLEGHDRGVAAMTLGLLGATEYAPRLAELVRSDDNEARAGAATGLGLMKAREHAAAVAGLLELEDADMEAEACAGAAVSALAMMGAKEYAPKIAKLLSEDLLKGGLNREAAFALVELGAREHAKDIAVFLDGKFSRRWTAKALAALRATEYAPRIAGLLRDESPLVRKDAALALGLMEAKEHAAQVASALDDEEGFVVSAAAVSLLLMGADAYAERVVATIDEWNNGRIPLQPGDLASYERYQRALARARESLARMRGQ